MTLTSALCVCLPALVGQTRPGSVGGDGAWVVFLITVRLSSGSGLEEQLTGLSPGGTGSLLVQS